ncbi:class I SAM-dependent methyltransferase [Nocardia sp. NPDC050175]|uniref:class I SAM-dependent methyltransferase n=1 Tax=Nocardia sp. NPDC050175 TaxID=3364317 RepID=UPI003789574E
MAGLEWNHNSFYHRFLVRRLPKPCARVLDVGCGAGAFAAELARQVEQVDAIDRSPVMIDAAKQATPDNVTCILGDVLEQPLPAASYDAIVSISTLHHLPLDRMLPVLADALRPGGVLAVVALPRTDLLRELPVEILAVIGHRVLGVVFAGLRGFGRKDWHAIEPNHAAMPVVLDPPLTTRQVRQQAVALLPGARVRRLVYWRYALVWQKPADS